MYVRIAGGGLRGRRVRAPRSRGLRPTTERVRSAIFSSIGDSALEGSRVADLFAGTGVMGMEALSRGAAWADYVESDVSLARGIRRSLEELGLADRGHVYTMSVERALAVLPGGYQLAFLDPPYAYPAWGDVLSGLSKPGLVAEGGIVVAEHSARAPLAAAYGRLAVRSSRRYGDTGVTTFVMGPVHG